MILSIHSSATFQGEGSWPSIWPPVKLPAPGPLAAAATSLWSPKFGTIDSTVLVDPNSPLYSTQLQPGGQSVTPDSQSGNQMAFLDQRIALMRFDASHTTPDSTTTDEVAA